MRAEVDATGDIRFHDLSPVCADALLRVGELMRSADPRVRRRLYPDTFVDPEEERQWRQLAGTELEHLVQSREEILRKDLATLEQDSPFTFRLRIRSKHRGAWLSSLNAARLALFALHGLDAGDMEAEIEAVEDEAKQLALVRIHVMAYLQEMLIRAGEVDGPGDIDVGQ